MLKLGIPGAKEAVNTPWRMKVVVMMEEWWMFKQIELMQGLYGNRP